MLLDNIVFFIWISGPSWQIVLFYGFHGFGAAHHEHKVALCQPNDRDVILCYLPKRTGSSIGLILLKIYVQLELGKRAEAATRKRLHRKRPNETLYLGFRAARCRCTVACTGYLLPPREATRAAAREEEVADPSGWASAT